MWQPGREGSLGENVFMYTYGYIPSLFIWNYHNIVDQLYWNTILKVKKKKKNCLWRSCYQEGHGKRWQQDYTPPAGTFIFLQGNYMRVRRGGWTCPIPPPAAAAKSLQSCPTLCDPIDGSPSGSLIPGILQARTLEWVVISFSNAWKWKVKVKLLSRVW